MKLLEKNVELGEKKFKISTDRNIAIQSFEAYPDVIEYIIKNKGNVVGEEEMFLDAIKNKELSKLFEINDKLATLVEFVLPLMLKKANDNSNAQEIIEYAKENDALEEFNSAIVEFLFLGFTQRGLGKPKIKFSMT